MSAKHQFNHEDDQSEIYFDLKPAFKKYQRRRKLVRGLRFIKRNAGLMAIAIGWVFVFAGCSIDVAPNVLTPEQRTAGELGVIGICSISFGCGYMARGDGDD